MDTETVRGATFGIWLKRHLARRDWSQADFARRMGVANGDVSRWARGARIPSPETIDRIADVLGVDVDLALTIAGHRPPDFDVEPDSPEARLLPLIRRVEWNEERVESVEQDLRLYIERDRRKRQER